MFSAVEVTVRSDEWDGKTGFQVLTAVVMKGTIFRDITPCSPFKVNRRFGGTYASILGSKNKPSKKPA
jgi:hypothetical protein